MIDPDLVYRIRNGLELNMAYDYSTFFGGNSKGYTDYKGYDEWIKSKWWYIYNYEYILWNRDHVKLIATEDSGIIITIVDIWSSIWREG